MKEEKTAVFPGSFDPFTIGHQSIIKRGLKIFDKIIVAIGINSEKKTLFDLKIRKKWLEDIFQNEDRVLIDTFSSLTVEYCLKNKANFILRGLRTSADFEYERQIGQMNKHLKNSIETIFLLTDAEHTFISSTIVREIIKYKSDIKKFVPKPIADKIYELYQKN